MSLWYTQALAPPVSLLKACTGESVASGDNDLSAEPSFQTGRHIIFYCLRCGTAAKVESWANRDIGIHQVLLTFGATRMRSSSRETG